ncbi:MAG: hypothetical protein ACM3JD_05900 [Rudaea sp.]
MVNLAIAYALIAVVLTGYGVTLYNRTQAVARRIRMLEEEAQGQKPD